MPNLLLALLLVMLAGCMKVSDMAAGTEYQLRDAGVLVDPREVIVTHGCVDALQMSLRVLTRPGDLIAAESPTYYGLLQLADLLGLKVIEIPSDPSKIGRAHV